MDSVSVMIVPEQVSEGLIPNFCADFFMIIGGLNSHSHFNSFPVSFNLVFGREKLETRLSLKRECCDA